MPIGEITSYVNVAQLVLYAFWIFFAGLIIYLRREDKREGYPLESDRSDRSSRVKVVGWPLPPKPKTYRLPLDQGTRQAPHAETYGGEIPGTTQPSTYGYGTPLEPTGDPMRDGVGPASYADRDDLPDLAVSGLPKVVPMRIAQDFHIETNDPDPRGMAVVAADGVVVGTVSDLWVDRAEHRILFFEVELSESFAADNESELVNPLLPYGFASVKFFNRTISVVSISAEQFTAVPRTASGDQVTRLEEDRITAYFSSGLLYGTAQRQEPLI